MIDWLSTHWTWLATAGILLVAGGIFSLSSREWFRQPVILTRGQAVAASVMVGGLFSLTVIGVDKALSGLDADREKRAQELIHEQNKKRKEAINKVRGEQLTKAQIAALARRIARKESEEGILQAIRKASRVCQRRPQECRAAAAPFLRATGAQRTFALPTPDQIDRQRRGSSTPTRPVGRRPRPRPQRPASGPPTPGQSGQPDRPPVAVDPTPPPGRPAVDLQTPDGIPLPKPRVCPPGGIVGINC